MARIEWGARSERYFESGVDRGVLYIDSVGVAWPGIASVNESPSGGTPRPLYLDGLKYLNLATSEEYGATITAYNAPAEFSSCDGIVGIHNGLYATQQRRREFSLSYRTRVGNDVDGAEHAYKIHLVYNAMAAPSQRNNNSNGNSVDPIQFSWAITTRPPSVTGVRPTSHYVVDSRTADPEVLAVLEDFLYGTEADAPTLPTPDELIALFTP